ncbi:MAG: hypothetical protein QMD71_02265 [bacterium]|nr:hypothetical protein [bacterium]
MIPAFSSAFEVTVRKTLDTWYGAWYEQISGKVDTSAITEAETYLACRQTGIGVAGYNLRGEIGLLYNTYWDKKFHIKDTSRLAIVWKDVGFDSRLISVDIGDFYCSLGHGLILGMEPIKAMGRERYIEGIKIETKLPWIKLSEIYGTPYEIDRLQKNYKILNDTSDAIFGVNVSTNLLLREVFLISGRGMRLKTGDTLYTNLWGTDFEFNSQDWFSFYLELAKKSGWDRIDFEPQSGSGVYSSLDIYPYGINIQFINYNKLGIGDMAYRYNLMPILNRSGYSINNGRDEIGFQLNVNKAIGEVVFEGSYSEIDTKDTTEIEKDKKILEYYLGADFRNFNGSLKFLSLSGDVAPHFNKRRELDTELYSNFKNIEATFSMKKIEGVTFRDTIPFFDIGLTVGIPVFDILTVYSNYTRRSKEVIEESPGIEWYGIGIRAELDKVSFDSWYGKEKGGYVCSAGVCHYLTPFEGFKLKLNISL